ncbi:MAG: thioredoxin family protein, partial [Proteobacteria bacterium]|nr:thioredoxin family protein [Pseudomonadota bacterium]
LFAACAPSVDSLTGLPQTGRPLAQPATPGAMTMPGQGWRRGVMAYRVAMGLRQRRRVPVLLFFFRPDCPYCRSLLARYFHQPEFLRGTAGIIKVMVNTRGSPADQALTNQLRITGTPTILVYPGRGRRPREVIIIYQAGNKIRRKPMARVIAEIRRKAFGR